MDQPPAEGSASPWPHRLAWALAACTLFLILTGTTVTTNEYRPLYSLGLWHVPSGAVVAVLTLALAIWLLRTGKSAGPRQLVWTLLAATIIEALLGLPSEPQPPAVRFFHSLMAQVFFAALVAVAIVASSAWKQAARPEGQRSAILAMAKYTPLVVLAQAALGAAFRHGIIGVLWHILGAMLIAVYILIVCMAVMYREGYEPLRPAGVTLLIITGVQVFLGFTLFTMTVMEDIDPQVVIITTMIHAATAALTLAASVVMAALVMRGLPARPAEAAESARATQ